MNTLKIGMKARVELTVEHQHTAAAFGSGDVTVFATPMMIGIMENAALKAVDQHLTEGQATVGTHLDVKHLAATPIGMRVWADAELTAIDGKSLTFSVKAYDEKKCIGEGTHQRYIIDVAKFLAKVNEQ